MFYFEVIIYLDASKVRISEMTSSGIAVNTLTSVWEKPAVNFTVNNERIT